MAHLFAFLYGCCFVLFGGLVAFITIHDKRFPDPRLTRLRRTFVLLALSLMTWQATYLLESHVVSTTLQLHIGRLNFTIVVFTVYLALRFVQEIACKGAGHGNSLPPRRRHHVWRYFGGSRFWLVETCLLAALTLLTPLIDAGEWLEAGTGQPISRYGELFPLYLVHVVFYLGAAIALVIRARKRTRMGAATRKQLTLTGVGTGITGAIGFVCSAVLPYALGDFRYCDLGILSTLFFVLVVAYAVFVHGLFDLRVIVRETLVYGILLTFVLGGYSAAVLLVTQYLTGGADRFTQLVVLLIASSFDPLRRLLEKKVDRMLFGGYKKVRRKRTDPRLEYDD